MAFRVLGIVPARSGSKGVSGKNLCPLGGRPLLAFTAEAALAAKRLDRVVLSTDDPQIAAVGRDFGLETPFIRPAELARDDTPTLPVVQHALALCQETDAAYDAVCLLQPTAPFRQAGLIDLCIERLIETGADAVVTVLPVPPEHNPHWAFFIDSDRRIRPALAAREPIPRRQDLPPAVHREGSVYVTRTSTLDEHNSLYGEHVVGHPVDPRWTVTLDTPADLRRAEAILETRLTSGGE